MSVANIIQRRQQALIKAWMANPLIMVQVESPQCLPGLVFLEDGGDNATVGQVGRRREADTIIVRRPGNPDTEASVWVRASYSGYRGAFLAFVQNVYGIRARTAALTGYDVDHLLNRARSPQGSGYIRIEAVASEANQAWGRLFEKNASNPVFHANQARMRRTMSWVICAKLAGLEPPSGPHDTAGIERLVQFFQGVGLDATEAREGLNSMLSFAYKFA